VAIGPRMPGRMQFANWRCQAHFRSAEEVVKKLRFDRPPSIDAAVHGLSWISLLTDQADQRSGRFNEVSRRQTDFTATIRLQAEPHRLSTHTEFRHMGGRIFE
jgi:hypothetical protein